MRTVGWMLAGMLGVVSSAHALESMDDRALAVECVEMNAVSAVVAPPLATWRQMVPSLVPETARETAVLAEALWRENDRRGQQQDDEGMEEARQWLRGLVAGGRERFPLSLPVNLPGASALSSAPRGVSIPMNNVDLLRIYLPTPY